MLTFPFIHFLHPVLNSTLNCGYWTMTKLRRFCPVTLLHVQVLPSYGADVCQEGPATHHKWRFPQWEQKRPSQHQPPERDQGPLCPLWVQSHQRGRKTQSANWNKLYSQKKKYIHIARPASAVSQVSPDQQMLPDGQYRAVNCSSPLVVLQAKSLYLGGGGGGWIYWWAGQVPHDTHISNTRNLPVLPEHGEGAF